MKQSVEKLTHCSCAACKKWWTIGDAARNKQEWFCPWCGMQQPEQKKKLVALSRQAKNIKPGTYKHFKGDIMEVVGVALHSEMQGEFVVYRHTTGGHAGEQHYWIRPIEMFVETVERNGKRIKRFTYVRE